MDTQPQAQSITPAWKVFTAIGFAGVVGAAVTYFRDGSTAAVIAGMIVLAIGLPLTVWSILRMLPRIESIAFIGGERRRSIRGTSTWLVLSALRLQFSVH
ncbi:hypothetical protein ACHMZP_28245 [Rhodococcus baikonurensis]|uniref:hypothetical protein n=1 Tax=Rhodococcus baikonurensis TaxID=172041 RepID=UPI0037BD8D6E